MDPAAAFAALSRAMTMRDRTAVAEHADALVGWFEKEGFRPVLGDWRDDLTLHALKCYLRDIRHVAEMI